MTAGNGCAMPRLSFLFYRTPCASILFSHPVIILFFPFLQYLLQLRDNLAKTSLGLPDTSPMISGVKNRF